MDKLDKIEKSTNEQSSTTNHKNQNKMKTCLYPFVACNLMLFHFDCMCTVARTKPLLARLSRDRSELAIERSGLSAASASS